MAINTEDREELRAFVKAMKGARLSKVPVVVPAGVLAELFEEIEANNKPPKPARVDRSTVRVPVKFVRFLLGDEPDENGLWLGNKLNGVPYWWRDDLRKLLPK